VLCAHATFFLQKTYGCRARTRTDDEPLQQEQLTKAGTQIGTQKLPQAPNVTKVLTAWPTLSPVLQAAILAIATTPNP
jgi:hypothetical protein